MLRSQTSHPTWDKIPLVFYLFHLKNLFILLKMHSSFILILLKWYTLALRSKGHVFNNHMRSLREVFGFKISLPQNESIPAHIHMSVLREGFQVQTPKWIRSCYKVLKMHKNNMPNINGKSSPNSLPFQLLLAASLDTHYHTNTLHWFPFSRGLSLRHIHTYVHAHIYTYIHTHTYTYTYIWHCVHIHTLIHT